MKRLLTIVSVLALSATLASSQTITGGSGGGSTPTPPVVITMPSAALGTNAKAYSISNAGTPVLEMWVPGSGGANPADLGNTFVGVGAGSVLIPDYSQASPTNSGNLSAYFGWNAGLSNTTGGNNTFVGAAAGRFNTTGADNTFVGEEAGGDGNPITGSSNTLLGQKAGAQITSAGSVVYIGKGAGGSFNGANNIVIGANAADSVASTGTANVVIGTQAAQFYDASHSVIIGQQAGQATSGNHNTGADNVVIGSLAGTLNRSGTQNVLVGRLAGQAITTSGGDVCIGYQACNALTTASWNIMIGPQAGVNDATGQGNIFIGNGAGSLDATGANNTAGTNTFVAGGNDTRWSMNDIWFGKGMASAAPTAYTIHGTNGVGTDINAGSVTVAGGQGTGVGTGGNIIFQTAPAAAGTASTQNALVTQFVVDQLGHLRVGAGTAPALTSCGTGSPTITGTDQAGIVTMGTSATGCVITFNKAYAAAPFCVVTWIATPLASQSYVTANTAITLTQTSTSGNKVQYICIGQNGG